MKNIAVLLTLATLTAAAVAGVPTGTMGAKDAVHVAPLTYCPPPSGGGGGGGGGGGTPTPVPEVQEYAAMAGAALVGLEALRRRRNARKA